MSSLCFALLLALAQESARTPPPPGDASAPFTMVILREHKGDTPGAGYGHGLAFLGDVDRDGVPDYAIGAPRDPSRPETDGSVAVHSGKSGRLLFLHRGLEQASGFGFAVAGGDCNGDGIGDVVIGAPYASSDKHDNAGSVLFFSGKDGRLLRQVWGGDGDGFGWTITALGDIDKDGADDYAISAPYADRGRSGTAAELDIGRVEVHSGKKSRVLYTLWGDAAEDRFGWCLTTVDDCNGDKVPDLLVGAEGATKGDERPGSASLVSGRSGEPIARFFGDSGTYFGAAVCSLPDVDGDGRPELVVGAWNAGADDLRTGEVRVLSSRGGKLLHTLRGHAHLDQFGRALASAGDLDRDGVADFVVGAPSTTTGGYVQFVSGKSFAVLAELHGSIVGERYGATLRAADLDGDGRREVLVGVGLADAYAKTAGRVLLLGVPTDNGK